MERRTLGSGAPSSRTPAPRQSPEYSPGAQSETPVLTKSQMETSGDEAGESGPENVSARPAIRDRSTSLGKVDESWIDNGIKAQLYQ